MTRTARDERPRSPAAGLAVFTVVSASAIASADPGFAVGNDAAPPRFARESQRPRHAGQTLFVNFEGADIRSGSDDDARRNQTEWEDYVGSYPAYGTVGAKRHAVAEAVRAHYYAYDVTVTDQRPPSGSYGMVMVGPSGHGGGWATVDCGDDNPNSMGFVDRSAGDGWSAAATGALIAHEAGHAFGLDHVSDDGQVMNQTVYASTVFADECTSVDGSNFCSCAHRTHCSSGRQNSHRELLGYLGERIPDTSPPQVRLTFPVDGQSFAEGASFDVRVDASDTESGIDEVRLFVNGTYEARDIDTPYGWGITGIPAGTYQLYALALDVDGNEAVSNVVTITVNGGAGSESGPSSDSGGTSSSGPGDGSVETGSDGGGSGTEGPPPGLPPWDDGEARGTGCGCRSGRRPSALFGVLTLLGLVRRRTT